MISQQESCNSKNNGTESPPPATCIDWKLFPIKAHFFLYCAGLAGVLPYIPVFGKQLGISATQVGIVYTTLPFMAMVAKPLFGGISDKFQNMKQLLLGFIVVQTVFFVAVNFIPRSSAISLDRSVSATVLCSQQSSSLLFVGRRDLSCLFAQLNDSAILCDISCKSCPPFKEYYYYHDHNNKSSSASQDAQVKSKDCFSFTAIVTAPNMTSYLDLNLSKALDLTLTNVSAAGTRVDSSCDSNLSLDCKARCLPNMTSCFDEIPNSTSNSMYLTVQFWLFFVFVIFGWVSMSVTFCLSDASCYGMLAGQEHNFGIQRMWGTIGWGAFGVISGFLIDVFTGGKSTINYAPGFYLLAGLMAMDFVSILKADIQNTSHSKNMMKDLFILLSNAQVLLFAAAVFACGILTSLQWNYAFWYLEELGASQLLMGLTIAVQSFCGELPFFFFSGWIIKKLGHIHTLTLAFIAFGVRYVAYSYLRNPWFILPVELTQGATFGSFYAAMTSFAKSAALPGTEATVQGILGGAFEGLGLAIGGFIGGVSIDKYGSRSTFRYGGIMAVLCGMLHVAANFLLVRVQSRSKSGNRTEIEACVKSPSEVTDNADISDTEMSRL